ncbi:remorin isoform X2 [Vigna angularis]|uniref:remorin isoform X2 n=1 Tax=Phaseolus angularis TaxID=3914 RepID=UPI0022B41BE5|nr:remorin isoform X2 [Vigna angularis]
METLMKQIRVKLTGAEEENKADLGGSRDQKLTTQKTPSFKDKKKVQSWFQRQFSRNMSHDYDTEMEHATAVAAAAYAIFSQEVSLIPQQKKMRETPLSRGKSKVDDRKPPFSQFGSTSRQFSGETKPEAPHIKGPPLVHQPEPLKVEPLKVEPLRPPPPPPPLIEQNSARPRANETKADAWEREELEKIKERYEKLLETIESWEKRKKAKAIRKLNKLQHGDSERKRAKALKKYEEKMNYINQIAGGARAQAAERRRNEVLKAKEKANIIRTTGKIPGPCSCF